MAHCHTWSWERRSLLRGCVATEQAKSASMDEAERVFREDAARWQQRYEELRQKCGSVDATEHQRVVTALEVTLHPHAAQMPQWAWSSSFMHAVLTCREGPYRRNGSAPICAAKRSRASLPSIC